MQLSTQELKEKARRAVLEHPRGAFIEMKIATNFWVKEFGISVHDQNISAAIDLFEKTFFIERKEGFGLMRDSFFLRGHEEVCEIYSEACSKKENSGHNSKAFHHNYWQFIFAFFIVTSAATLSLQQSIASASKKEKTEKFKAPQGKEQFRSAVMTSDATPLPKTQRYLPNRPIESFSIVFVVNITHQDVIDSIKSSGTITSEISDDLCRATKALWAGSSSDFRKTKLDSEWISSRNDTSSETQSTFDVYLVLIEVKAEALPPGLKEKERLSSRLEAFRWIAMKEPRARVTQRLPDSSFTETEVYRL